MASPPPHRSSNRVTLYEPKGNDMIIEAIAITPEGVVRPVARENGGSWLPTMYREIDCHAVDVVALTTGIDMWLDDEGMYTKDINIPATILARQFGYLSQPYMGTVLLTGGADSVGDTTPLSEDKLKALLSILAEMGAIEVREI